MDRSNVDKAVEELVIEGNDTWNNLSYAERIQWLLTCPDNEERKELLQRVTAAIAPFLPTQSEVEQIDVNKDWDKLTLEDKQRWQFTHPRDEKERRAIRNMIAAEIAPLLLPEGFVKCCTTFLRRYGPDLLQCLSINYRGSVGIPVISLTNYKLFNFMTSWESSFVGIKTNPGIEGTSIETLLGIKVDPFENSYLGFRENYAEAIAIEKKLLAEQILPMLNGMRTIDDYIQHLYGDNEIRWLDGISIAVYKKDYRKAQELALQRIDYIQRSAEEYALECGAAIEEAQRLTPWMSQNQAICQQVVQAIEHGDTACLEKLMNDSQSAAYAALQKYTKTFAKKYPLKPILLT